MAWWHWLVLGFALCVAELAMPAFVLIWFGLGALLVGVLTWLLPFGLVAQVVAWTVFSAAMLAVWLRYFRDRRQTTRAGASDAAIGEIGLLVRGVQPFGPPGEVLFQRPLLGSDRWLCNADVALPPNARVRVVAVEGNVVRVEAAG
ncbi:NfeD family protein [Candidatus Dactylopiibacterium carminicum]|nr:NfeD family protein [Candidatus Dactylopiibacterium carminicum]